MRLSVAAGVVLALAACDPPSASVDAGDLLGVFDETSASAPIASSSAAGAGSARTPPRERPAEEGTCVADTGTADGAINRIMGRPACRAAQVLEWRDPSGAPRYACVYSPSETSKRAPLPLVVYFHGTGPGLDDPSSLPKLTSLRAKLDVTDMSRDPAHRGFIVLAVQGRAIAKGKWGATFDSAHVSQQNLDKLATDHFVDELIGRELVDQKRIYAIGMGRGGQMAATYAMLRADRVAAFAAFAPLTPPAQWQCPGPPPPGMVLYRACDAVVPCESVEKWLGAREEAGAQTRALRLGDDNSAETNCAPRNKCSDKKGQAHHLRWPKGREKELLEFLSGHVLE